MSNISEVLAELPRPNLVYGMPEMLAFQIGREDGLVGTQESMQGNIDANLLVNAAASGYRTFVPGYMAPVLVQAVPVLKVGDITKPFPGGTMVELVINQDALEKSR